MTIAFLLLAAAAPVAGQCASDAVTRPLLFIIQADNDRDLSTVMNYYSDDPVFQPPGKAPIRGRRAIRESYVAMYRDLQPNLTIDFAGTQVGDGVATVSGRTGGWLDPRPSGPRKTVNDRFEALMLCDGASWTVATLRWWPADDGSKSAQ